MYRRLALLLLALLTVAAPARAGWYKAETDRFVVYGEGREQRVRDYAIKLTTFDRTLRLFHPSTIDRVPNTKVIVYLVNDREDLQRIRTGLNRQIGGATTLAFGRKRIDPCKSFAMGRTDLVFTWAELGVAPRAAVVLLNPLTAWTGPGS